MSILKIFRNLKLFIFFLSVLLSAISFSLFNLGQDLLQLDISKKMQTNNESILKFNLDEGDISIQLLKEHQLHMKTMYDSIDELRNQDLIRSSYIAGSKTSQSFSTILTQMNALHTITTMYYVTKDVELLNKVSNTQAQLTKALFNFNQDVVADFKFKNNLALYLALGALLNVSLLFIWYTRRLSVVYKDIKTILNIEEEDRNKIFKTQEFTAIKRRMERRPLAGGGKNLLDPLTEILNEKGIINEFVQRNSVGSKEHVCVTVFDIDDFKGLGQNHGKAFTDTVIKKLAFIINLEKKASDIVGRIGEDQFVVITSRNDQNEAFLAVDAMRQTIEKTTFKTTTGKIHVTVSGGFIPKDKHEKIESAIGSANALVKRAKLQGKNQIAKQHGFASDKNDRM